MRLLHYGLLFFLLGCGLRGSDDGLDNLGRFLRLDDLDLLAFLFLLLAHLDSLSDHLGLFIVFLFCLLEMHLALLDGFLHKLFFFGALSLLGYPERLGHLLVLDGALRGHGLLLLLEQVISILFLLFVGILGSNRRRGGRLLFFGALLHILNNLFVEEHLHGLLVQLSVTLAHELLECDKVVDSNDLVDNLLVNGVLGSLVARLQENLLRDAKFREQMTDQLLDQLLELCVHRRVLQLVLFLIVENDAMVVEEAHDGRLPARRTQEVDNDVEEPVVLSFSCWRFSWRGRRASLGLCFHFNL